MKVGNSPAAKILVFYRDLPESLTTLINTDGYSSIIKDGVKSCGSQKVPRITVILGANGELFQKKRLAKFEKILETLKSNNQIIDFKIIS